MRILALGDFHHPDREILDFEEVEKIKEKYNPDIVVFTGDFTEEYVYKKLLEIFKEKKVYAVRGNVDSFDLPLIQKFKIENYKFVVYHGHGIYPRGDINQLKEILLKYNGDVLITGHTHKPSYINIGKLHIINPGSFTGAYSGECLNISYKSFAIIDVLDNDLIVNLILKKK